MVTKLHFILLWFMDFKKVRYCNFRMFMSLNYSPAGKLIGRNKFGEMRADCLN
jgi:hypothetical protein